MLTQIIEVLINIYDSHIQVDLFEIDSVSLGKLTHAVVGHDGEGAGEGWFLEKIVVQEGEEADYQWTFPCRKYVVHSLFLFIISCVALYIFVCCYIQVDARCQELFSIEQENSFHMIRHDYFSTQEERV